MKVDQILDWEPGNPVFSHDELRDMTFGTKLARKFKGWTVVYSIRPAEGAFLLVEREDWPKPVELGIEPDDVNLLAQVFFLSPPPDGRVGRGA
jgi:hypothetical protein